MTDNLIDVLLVLACLLCIALSGASWGIMRGTLREKRANDWRDGYDAGWWDRGCETPRHGDTRNPHLFDREVLHRG